MAPKTMHAVVLTGHGGLDKLEYRDDVPVPEPGPGEVRIEISACGMNNTDVWVREGAYGTRGRPGRGVHLAPRPIHADLSPHPGHRQRGTIEAVGRGCEPARIGQRVMVDFSIYNRDDDSLADIDYMGHGRDGGYAEYQVVPSDHAHGVRTDISDAELATFCCAYLTGEHMLDRVATRRR